MGLRKRREFEFFLEWRDRLEKGEVAGIENRKMNGSLTAGPLKLGGLYGCTGLEPALGRTSHTGLKPALGRTGRTRGRHRFLISSEHLNKRPKAINNLRFHHVKKVNESLFLKLGW